MEAKATSSYSSCDCALPHARKPVRPIRYLIALTLLVPASAGASGITLGRFGGVFGHPNAGGGLALYWNPALLAVETGPVVSADLSLVMRRASYDRVVLESNPNFDAEGVQEYNTGRGTTSTTAVLPYGALGGALDAGPVRIGVAAGLYPAYGGSVEWDKALDTPAEYPGAIDGPQRWASIASQLLSIHYSGALAISVPDVGLSIGATLSYADGSLDTTRARNVNREEEMVDSLGNLQEGRVWLDAEGSALAGSLGVSYETGRVRLSAVYRTAYHIRFEGPLTQAFATQPPGPVDSYIVINFPHVLQTGFEVEFDRITVAAATDFSTWSRMVNTDLLSDAEEPEMLLAIPRDLDNTLSVRGFLGGDIINGLHLSGMFGIDPSAVPPKTNEPGLNDALKFQLGLGARIDLAGDSQLLVSYVEDVYTTVEVDDSIQEPPQNGTYRDSRRWMTISFDGRF